MSAGADAGSGSRLQFVVDHAHSGVRLDRFLAGVCEGRSRATLQRWIENGRVAVGGAVVTKTGERVKGGAVVTVDPEPPPPTRAVPEHGVPFDVLYVDDEVVVVDKPAGVVVHPAKGHTGGTLVNGLLARGLFTAEVESDVGDDAHQRPGIVHRLDKGTSGVMVVARTASAREALKAQFAAHTIGREYEALCAGDVAARTIATLHARHPTDRLRFTSRLVKAGQGKRAVTRVSVLERIGEGCATHVLCELETGRTHQIRVHLADAGTPVLGDPLYGKPPRDASLLALADALGHQALHARLLAFVHPKTGARMTFTAPPPADFLRTLEGLRALFA